MIGLKGGARSEGRISLMPSNNLTYDSLSPKGPRLGPMINFRTEAGLAGYGWD